MRIVSLCAILGATLFTACDSGPAQPTPTPTVLPTTIEATSTAPLAPPTSPPTALTSAPVAAPTQGAPETPTPAAPGDCVNRAGNVRDVTIPDDTALRPGTQFTKTWRLRNAGTCTWTDAYTLIFLAGDRMDGVSTNRLAATPPNADIDVSVVLTAPFRTGNYKGYWKLRDPNGRDFGTGAGANVAFWVQIIVRR
jgi:hypothetical protein